jgi:hypothetical protein
MQEALDYYAKHGAALFPLPQGSKAPGPVEFWSVDGKAGSFKHHFSTDPAQWKKWLTECPHCNFGVVGFASQWIIVDIDTSGGEAGQAEAWQIWTELCLSWGLPEPLAPQVQSARKGWHCYFAVPAHIDLAEVDGNGNSKFGQPDAIKQRINVRVIGYTVAAGSYYDGTARGEESGWYQLFDNAPAPHPAPQALIDHCTRPERTAVAKVGNLDKGGVAGMLDWLNERDVFDPYEDWLACGMACKIEFGDAGLELWAHTHNDTVTPNVIATKWASFASEPAGNSVTLNTFMKRAHDLGWKGGIAPPFETRFKGLAQLAASPPLVPGQVPPVPNLAYTAPDASATARGPQTEDEQDPDKDYPFVEPCLPEKFGDDWSPPDYLIDGFLQKRFCYSLTAQTDTGKTNVALRLAAHVATGRELGNIEVEKGTVLYFAGENPEDVKGRWWGLTREMKIDPKKTDVIFVFGTTHISKTIARYKRYFEACKIKLSLVVVDTAAAYFEGDKEDDNKQAGDHARLLRSLRHLPGDPCVLTLCHPTKGAKTLEDMIPRGGSAFVNEVDGNCGAVRDDSTVVVTKVGKFRGNAFAPLHFALKVITDDPHMVDTKGRQQTTVIAEPISYGEAQRREEKADKDEDKVLGLLCDNPKGMIQAAVAKAFGGWSDNKAKRALESLEANKLVECTKRIWTATPKGQKYLNRKAEPSMAIAPPAPADLGRAPFPTPNGAPMPPHA